jgi:hypothetical protein
MHGSVRIYPWTHLAVFVGWSLLVHARELVARRRSPPAPTVQPAPPSRAVAGDDKMRWN